MTHLKKILVLFVVIIMSVSCSSSTGIFPVVNTSTNEADVELPNPISVVVDAVNNQLIVVNSNVDILFSSGSIAVLDFDATNTSAPVLSVASITVAPNFAGEAFFDGVSAVYVPFREQSPSANSFDRFVKYNVQSGTVSQTGETVVAGNPYGVAGAAGRIYVVSDDVLSIFDTSLTLQSTVDLTVADTNNISDSKSDDVLSVAVDTTNNLAVVSNVAGRVFIVDLATNRLIQAIDGPTSTRQLLIDSNSILYIVDALTELVWVFDLNQLPAVSNAPQSVEDSAFLIGTVSVGQLPFGLALDTTNNRLYVSNNGEDSISVIDTVLLQELARIPLDQNNISSAFLRDGDQPMGLAVGTFNSQTFLFVAGFGDHAVLVVNTNTLEVVEVFPNTKRL